MDCPKCLQRLIGIILAAVFLAGCGAPAITPAAPPTFPPPPLPNLPPPTLGEPMRPPGQAEPLKFLQTIQVTPDDEFLTGSFARINYVPATDHFVVTFGTKATTQSGNCQGAGYAYKEYTLDMQATGKAGRLIWYPNACEAGDSGSVMVDNSLYYAFVPQEPGQPYGWHLSKFDAVNWTMSTETYFSLENPTKEGNLDPTVAFVNGQLDVSDQYNPNGNWPDGSDSHHHFFSVDLKPVGKRILADTPHISGASMIYVDGVYYIVSANSFSGDLVVLKYDRDWMYLGAKTLINKAHWPTGLAFDGQRFYVAYMDTSQRTDPGFFPVHLNVHLAAFDLDWALVEDVPVTNFAPEDNRQPGRPWAILHNNRLYVSYDVDTIAPATQEEQRMWQGYVSVYEVVRGAP